MKICKNNRNELYFLNIYKKSFINNESLKKRDFHDFKRYLNIKKNVDSVMDKLKKFHLKGVEIATKNTTDNKTTKYIKISNNDREKSILCVIGILMAYVFLYIFYNKWSRKNELKRVQDSIEQYERDKLEYIETGITR